MSGARQTPQPLRTGANIPVLRCSLENCPFYCRSYVNYEGHLQNRHYCLDCANYYPDLDSHHCLMTGQRLGHADAGQQLDLTDFVEFSRSHGGSMVSYKYKHALNAADVETTFAVVAASAKKLLAELYKIHTLSKVEISIGAVMEKEIVEEDGSVGRKHAIVYFKSPHYELQTAGSINSILLQSASQIIEKKNSFIENGSSWNLMKINSFEIKIGEIRLFMNSRASGYLEMPFKSRQGYVNFKNKDARCFQYCIAAAIFYEEQKLENKNVGMDNKNLASHKTWEKYIPRIDFSCITGMVNIYNDLPKFESINGIAVNILSHRADNVVMIRSSSLRTDKVVNLFLIHKKVCKVVSYHLALIINLNKFLGYRTPSKAHFCVHCLRSFTSVNKLTEHVQKCKNGLDVVETFPREGETLKFNRPELTLPYPYILYYDFECFSQDVSNKNILGASTTIETRFEPASYSICIVHSSGDNQSIYALEYYDGENVVAHFFERVFKHAEDILWSIRTTNNFIVPTAEEAERHNNATHCDFCKREFTQPADIEDSATVDENIGGDGAIIETAFSAEENETSKTSKKVAKTYHHCHQSGKYLNTLCMGCNLKVKFKHELVCIAHNAAGFDFHLLIKHLENPLFDVKDISVISKNTEKFVQLEIPARDRYVPRLNREYNTAHKAVGGWAGNRKVKVRFIDSCQFLQNKLGSLAAALKKENASTLRLIHDSIPYILETDGEPQAKKHQIGVDDNAVNLLFEKLAFPYRYLASKEVLTVNYPIPSREHFDNDLCNEVCTDEEWDRVGKVCEAFNIHDFKRFTRLYTIIDTVLLAVIWENFRRNGMEMYGLDPTYMCTGSGYSWQCFLFKTKAEVEYIRDSSMLKFLSQGIRGGTTFCTRKIQTANNEQNSENYDAAKDRTHIIYLDKVSLYATALLDKFPHSNYMWVEKQELESIDWRTYDGADEKGYILQVTLGYPKDVQDKTVDLPLAPEKRLIHIEKLSERQQRVMNSLGNCTKQSFLSHPRLMLHCYNREEYTVHYKALKYYLEMGLTLLEIHKGISFTEKAYFRDYIQFNIDRRKVAKSESMRQFLKAQNNNAYGKCLQSNKNNTRVKFCSSRAQSQHLLSKPECVDFLPVSDKVSIVMLQPKTVTMNKPAAAGFTVLDLAKVIFYQGYYQQLKSVFGERIYNLYMDTDSSISLIKDPENSFWRDLVSNRQYFDFSKIPQDHEFFKSFAHIPDLRMMNAGESGKWKIESLNISEVVTLKSKQYSILYANNTEEMKAKGIPYSSLKLFSHKKYKDVVLQNSVVKMNVKYIRSVKHTLYYISVDKIGFGCI